jgi:hypothetical protein
VLNLNKPRLITEEIAGDGDAQLIREERAGDGLREIAGDGEKLSSLQRREQVSE